MESNISNQMLYELFLTSKKVREQTNQSLQFSVLHDNQGADSLAWYRGESPSSRDSKWGHLISPPWTKKGKEIHRQTKILFLTN